MEKKNNQIVKRLYSTANAFMNFLGTEEKIAITEQEIKEIKDLVQHIIVQCNGENNDALEERVLELLYSDVLRKTVDCYKKSTDVMKFVECCCVYDVCTSEEHFDEFIECIDKAMVILEFLEETKEIVREVEELYDMDLVEVELLLVQLSELQEVLDNRKLLAQKVQDINVPSEWLVYSEFEKLARYIYFYSQEFVEELEVFN